MATNFDKALYEAPEGDDLGTLDGEVEVTVTFDDDVDLDGFEGLELIDSLEEIMGVPFDANLSEYIEEDALNEIAADLIVEVENDLMSRRDWEEAIVEGIKLLGINPEERNIPWDGASNVVHPLITEAVVRFQSEAITETFPAAGPVKTTIIGKANPDKEAAAKRVEADMNYQLTEVMTEYRGEHERLLWSLPIMGSAFKKVYYDPSVGRQVSMFIPAEDVILPYGVSDISLTPRLTHRMRKSENDLLKLQSSGFYSFIEVSPPTTAQASEIQEAMDRETGFSATYDDRHELYEVQAELDLPGFEDVDELGEPTGIALPYVVTIHKQDATILSIRRNWEEGDHRLRKREHFVHYQYVPGFGAYGMGLLHLVGNSARAATSLQRQLIDAGTLANLPGGLKTRGLRIKGDDQPIHPGEWRDVDIGSGTLRDSIMPLPYKEPSQTLLAMMGVITEDAQRLASTMDMKISDMSSQSPVGTTLAIIERSLKILSAIQARMHYSMKRELKLLARIIRDYTDDDYDYDAEGVDEGREFARIEDFSYTDVIPVSDPNASTMAQRVVQYQAVLQLAQSAPQLYDMALLHRQMLNVLGIKNAEKLVKVEEDEKPADPIAENMNIINMKPVKAFMYQDHEAHIQAHMAAIQDPQIMELIGQNPNAQAMMAAAQAHIAEHVAFAYRQKIEEQMGGALPHTDEDLPPHVEAQLSRTVAQAAAKLLQKHQAEDQAAKNEAAQNDPVVQMQQKELEIKEGDLQIRQAKLAVDAARHADELRHKQEMDALKMELEAYKTGAKVALDQARLEAAGENLGLTVGVDIAKTHASLEAELLKAGLTSGVDIAKTAAAAQHAAELSREKNRRDIPGGPDMGVSRESDTGALKLPSLSDPVEGPKE